MTAHRRPTARRMTAEQAAVEVGTELIHVGRRNDGRRSCKVLNTGASTPRSSATPEYCHMHNRATIFASKVMRGITWAITGRGLIAGFIAVSINKAAPPTTILDIKASSSLVATIT